MRRRGLSPGREGSSPPFLSGRVLSHPWRGSGTSLGKRGEASGQAWAAMKGRAEAVIPCAARSRSPHSVRGLPPLLPPAQLRTPRTAQGSCLPDSAARSGPLAPLPFPVSLHFALSALGLGVWACLRSYFRSTVWGNLLVRQRTLWSKVCTPGFLLPLPGLCSILT